MKFLLGIILFFLFPYLSPGQCPTINTAMINACAIAPSTSEGINEFVYFSTSAAATAGDYTLSYGTVNPPLGGASSNILAGSNARTKNGPGSLTSSNGCVITYVTSPATVIPANSGVILIPSNFDNDYDLTGVCGNGSLYAILVDINAAPSNTWGPGGTFANSSGANLRYLQISNGATNCSSNIVSYNGNGWPGSADGNSVWWDGTPNYQNNGCSTIKPPKPTITPDPILAVCPGTPATMSFNTTGVPDQYSIDWNNAANTAGFIDVAAAPLPAFPIQLTPPASVPAGTYTGTLTVINSLTPDTSIPQNISVTVNPAPVITTQPADTIRACQNGPVNPLQVIANGGGGTITGYQWYLFTTGSGFLWPPANTSTFQPSTANLSPPPVYWYCQVSNSNGCFTISDTAALIVSPNLAMPAASATQQPTCAVPAGTITVTAPAATNILYSNSGAAGPYQVPGTFANLSPGTSYNIVAKDTITGCISPVRAVAISALPAGPVVTASVTSAPTCAVPTGTITVSSPTGIDYEYSVGGAYQPTTIFSGLAGGTTYNVTARQISTGCVSPIVAIPVAAITGAPATPGITVIHPDCITPTGSITVTAPLNANYEYSVGGAYQPTVLFSNLVPGTNYSVTVRDISTGCISAPHDTAMKAIPVLAPPGITTPLLSYCENETAPVLTATGTNLQWYTSLTGGTASSTAPTPVTTAVGVFKFYVSQKNGNCESTRDSITVTIKSIPALPGITGNTTAYCENEVATILTATGTNLQWYNVATGGSALTGAPTPSTAAAGNTTYYVTQTVNGCESGRNPIAITVNATPAAPDVSGNHTTYCKNEPDMGLTPVGPAFLWYTVPSGGTGSTTVPTVDFSTAGISNFYVSETINGCEGARATVTITVKDVPSAPSVITPAGFCQGSAGSLSATGTNLLWYTLPPPPNSGTGSPTAPTPSTSAIGSTDYYVTQTVNGCESPVSIITVNISAQPAAPVTAPLIYCQNENAPALTATGTGLLWYTAATGGPGSSIAPTPSISDAGITTYYVSQTINGCESGRTALAVTVNATPAPPSITDPIVQYCQNTTANPLIVTGSNILWYTAPSSGTGSAVAPVVSTAATGSTFHYVTQTVNGCESGRVFLTVTIVAVPTPPVPVTPVDYCLNQVASPVSANGIGLKWYSTLTSPTPLPSAPTPSTTTVGNVKYYVSQFINTCESKRDSTIVTIKPASPQPVVVSPVEYCQNLTAAALSAAGTNLQWYGAATGGTGSSTAPTPPTTTPGTTFFYVTQNANGCESTPRTAITVTVKVTSTAVTGFHYSSDAFCLNAVTPPSPFYDLGFTTGGTFTSTPAGLSINAATGDINLALSNTGTYGITYTYNTTGCVNGNTSATSITLNPAIPTEVRFSYNSPVCRDAVPALPQTLAGFTTGGVFTSVPGNLSINSSTGEVNAGNSQPGTYTILYNVNEQGCRQARSSSSGIIIIDTTSPVTKFNYSSTDICLTAGAMNPTISKATGFTTGGTFTVTPAGLSVNSITGDVNIGLSVAGTYIIKYSVPPLLCRYAGADSIVFKLTTYGAPVTGFSYVGPVCKGDNNAIPVMNTGFTEGGTFLSVPGLGVDATSGTIDLRQSIAGDYTIRYDVAQGACNPAGFGLATIKVLAQPEAPTVTSATVCGEGNVTLSAAALGTLSWYTDPALLNQVNVGSTFTTFISTTTPFYVTNTVGSCESEPAIANALANPVPVKPYMGGDTSICANEKLVLNAGTYNSYLWQDGSANSTYNVVNSGIYKVIVSTGVGCSDSASVTITVLDDCADIVFPNAFSPNGDIHNPTFGPWGNLFPVSNYSIRIYNRYGQEVFAAADPSKKWDGTYKGKVVDIGAYIYVATYVYKNKINKVKKGTVMVIR